VIWIRRDQANGTEIGQIISKNYRKMPIFSCSCGIEILIVPDIPKMNIAIKNHLKEHKKLSGTDITEELLTQEILKAISKALPET
jgi:hypothetical protein